MPAAKKYSSRESGQSGNAGQQNGRHWKKRENVRVRQRKNK
jgi:hypothetical protein